MSENIEEKIIKIIAQTLNKDESTIHPDSKLVEDLRMESLDFVQILMEIEAAFNCTVPDDNAGKFRIVGDVVKYVKEKIHD